MLSTPWNVRAALAVGLVVLLGSSFPVTAQSPGGGTDGGNVGGPPGGGGGGGGNTAPSIMSLNSVQVAGQRYRIYGQVADNTPASCAVTISGAASGVASCDAQGNFDTTLDVATPGLITAVASDGAMQSGQTNDTLVNNAPTVSDVMAVQGPGNTWTFSGTVSDEVPAGIIVSLEGPPGVNGQTATVNADGTFSVTVTLAPGTSGYVTATATDQYGETGSAMTYFGS